MCESSLHFISCLRWNSQTVHRGKQLAFYPSQLLYPDFAVEYYAGEAGSEEQVRKESSKGHGGSLFGGNNEWYERLDGYGYRVVISLTLLVGGLEQKIITTR